LYCALFRCHPTGRFLRLREARQTGVAGARTFSTIARYPIDALNTGGHVVDQGFSGKIIHYLSPGVIEASEHRNIIPPAPLDAVTDNLAGDGVAASVYCMTLRW
jgi:hypothetical protein